MADQFPELSEIDLTSLVHQKNSENTNGLVKLGNIVAEGNMSL